MSKKTDTIVATLIVVIFLPAIAYYIGYFAGWFTDLLIGKRVIADLNYLFNTDYFTRDMIPRASGVIAVIQALWFRKDAVSSKS